MERKGLITFKGITGDAVKIGDIAPDFLVVNNELKPVRLSDFKNELVVISSVPSLDTPVCKLQTKRFNEVTREPDYDEVLAKAKSLVS